MSEPTRTAQSSSWAAATRNTPRASRQADVLLIADEPGQQEKNGGRREKAQGGVALRPKAPEPLDVETVVRKLIALLEEEARL